VLGVYFFSYPTTTSALKATVKNTNIFLSLALEGEGVASLPASLARAAVRLAEAVSLAQTARRLAGRGETAELTVLVHRVANPLRLRVTTDSLNDIEVKN